MKITIPVSVGELIDRITILEIKAFLSDNEYIHKELEELNQIKSTITQYLLEYEVQLKKINETLWKIEDKIRQKEKDQEFDNEFIELARSVYINNDKRAEIKRKINEVTNSKIQEVKLYDIIFAV
jgi:predicted  nucleic acid-binding Zn-ribbon protein